MTLASGQNSDYYDGSQNSNSDDDDGIALDDCGSSDGEDGEMQTG